MAEFRRRRAKLRVKAEEIDYKKMIITEKNIKKCYNINSSL